jgi:hypothetical protein
MSSTRSGIIQSIIVLINNSSRLGEGPFFLLIAILLVHLILKVFVKMVSILLDVSCLTAGSIVFIDIHHVLVIT